MLPQPTTSLQRPRMPQSPSGLPSVRIFLISTLPPPPAHPLLFHPGRAAEAMGDLDRALGAYERALIINSQSWAALTMAAHVCRCKEDYGRVSPVSNSSLSAPFLPFSACVPVCISYSRVLQQSAPAPTAASLRSCPALRQAASETTTKDCRCLSMCVRVLVCLCLCLCIFLLQIFDVRSRLVGPRPAPPSRCRATSERASE
jgi:hypothetical protein